MGKVAYYFCGILGMFFVCFLSFSFFFLFSLSLNVDITMAWLVVSDSKWSVFCFFGVLGCSSVPSASHASGGLRRRLNSTNHTPSKRVKERRKTPAKKKKRGCSGPVARDGY